MKEPESKVASVLMIDSDLALKQELPADKY